MSRALPLLVGLALLGGVACSDNLPPEQRTVFVEGDPNRPIVYDDAGNPLPPPPGGGGYGRILLIAGEDERVVQLNGQIELAALLIDPTGEPVPQERVNFGFADETDPGDANLSAQAVFTDENGEARILFDASSDVRDIQVNAWSSATRVVPIIVHVRDLPVGGLDIHFDYAGPVALGSTEVYIVNHPDWCEDPFYLAAPDEVVRSGSAPNPDGSVLLDGLLAGSRVSIVVRARLLDNPRILAGGGCFGDVTVPEDENRRVTVPVFVLPLKPAGTYYLQNHFDFTDAIPGTLGDVIRELVRFFGDVNHEREIAGVIFDIVEALVREAAGFIGGLIVDLVRGWVEDDLNDIINGYIDNDGPNWLRDFFTIGSDVISIVSNMEVSSRMRITKPRRDGTFDGSQNWVGLAFYWRLPCRDNPDPACGRHAFTMDQLVAGMEGVDLVFGQFTGRIHSYNHGIIDRHTLDLQYGRLILFVLNNLVLPEIADGANNISDALLNMANCPSFANRMTGGNGHLRIGGINIVSRDTIEGWCTTVMGVAGDAATAILGRLRIDTRLTLDGEMLFIEGDSCASVLDCLGPCWDGTGGDVDECRRGCLEHASSRARDLAEPLSDCVVQTGCRAEECSAQCGDIWTGCETDQTNDLVPDFIEDGVWRGIIRTAEDEGPPFEGDFAGPREE